MVSSISSNEAASASLSADNLNKLPTANSNQQVHEWLKDSSTSSTNSLAGVASLLDSHNGFNEAASTAEKTDSCMKNFFSKLGRGANTIGKWTGLNGVIKLTTNALSALWKVTLLAFQALKYLVLCLSRADSRHAALEEVKGKASALGEKAKDIACNLIEIVPVFGHILADKIRNPKPTDASSQTSSLGLRALSNEEEAASVAGPLSERSGEISSEFKAYLAQQSRAPAAGEEEDALPDQAASPSPCAASAARRPLSERSGEISSEFKAYLAQQSRAPAAGEEDTLSEGPASPSHHSYITGHPENSARSASNSSSRSRSGSIALSEHPVASESSHTSGNAEGPHWLLSEKSSESPRNSESPRSHGSQYVISKELYLRACTFYRESSVREVLTQKGMIALNPETGKYHFVDAELDRTNAWFNQIIRDAVNKNTAEEQ